jgi:hypothetical protein
MCFKSHFPLDPDRGLDPYMMRVKFSISISTKVNLALKPCYNRRISNKAKSFLITASLINLRKIYGNYHREG